MDLPASERIDAWRDATASALIPNELSIDPAAEFRASLRSAEIGGAYVNALSYTSMVSRRTPALIRRSDPEMYAVALIRGGRQVIFQDGRESVLKPGDLVVYSTSHPYEAVVDARPSTCGSVVVQVPRAAVPLPQDGVHRISAARIPGRDGIGRLLAGFLTTLADDAGTYRPADSPRLGGVLNGLITEWLAHHVDAAGRSPAETREHTRFLLIQDFIRRNLDDPGLSPTAVAAAHHISLRTLHRLFRSHGSTVTSYIRRQRLDRARSDLADPRLAARPVHAIGARWGFPGGAGFSRVFRTEFGIPPGDYRRQRLGGRSGTPPRQGDAAC
nr:helix-turn-helix domain-containing protein [Streptomonospora sp. PA3]